ncbi:MAG: hypothetical protein E7618_07375 [Ruminococcaceae bacterium]|nr:hypothetical protein [Oscillospiraceae bacterium]
MEKNWEKGVPFDVIERYCPKQGENVIMLRTYGEDGRLSCTRYEACQKEKDTLCGIPRTED